MSHRRDSHSSAGSPSRSPGSGHDVSGPSAPSHDIPDHSAGGNPSEHRKGLLPEKYFRWRAGEISRLEAFCDVVFGFALTLLVVSLEVPRNYAELMTAMRGFVPFAVCFAQLIMIWRAHYQFSRRYGLEDSYTMMLNVVLLFLVLFYVYPMKFVFTMLFEEVIGVHEMGVGIGFHEGSVLMRIYAAGFTAVFVLFAMMYLHAYRLRKELGLNAVEALSTRYEIQSNLLTAAIGATSFAMAIKYPQWAGWWFFLLGPVLGWHGSHYGKRVRLLAGKMD